MTIIATSMSAITVTIIAIMTVSTMSMPVPMLRAIGEGEHAAYHRYLRWKHQEFHEDHPNAWHDHWWQRRYWGYRNTYRPAQAKRMTSRVSFAPQ